MKIIYLSVFVMFSSVVLLHVAGGRAPSWGECQGPCSDVQLAVFGNFFIITVTL